MRYTAEGLLHLYSCSSNIDRTKEKWQCSAMFGAQNVMRHVHKRPQLQEHLPVALTAYLATTTATTAAVQEDIVSKGTV